MIVSVKVAFLIVLIVIWTSAPAFCIAMWAQDQSSGSRTETAPAPQAEPKNPPAQTSPQAQPENPPATQPQAPLPPPQKKAGPSKAASRTKKKKTVSGKTKTTRQRADQSGKVVVRNGGAKEGPAQLSPGMTQEQQSHDRENTAQLLSTTDAKLKSIAGRQLSPGQQSMLDQIHTYVRQAKEATDSGDLTRAHTLAYKANLLSDELVKR